MTSRYDKSVHNSESHEPHVSNAIHLKEHQHSTRRLMQVLMTYLWTGLCNQSPAFDDLAITESPPYLKASLPQPPFFNVRNSKGVETLVKQAPIQQANSSYFLSPVCEFAATHKHACSSSGTLFLLKWLHSGIRKGLS
jgi:hypothetical protein